MANLLKIREIAKSKGITLISLAKAVGISEQGLQLILRKNVTSTDTLELIAAHLNVPVSTFFDDHCPTAQANGDGAMAIAGNNNVTIPKEVLVMLQNKDKQLQEKDKLIAELAKKLLG